MCVQVYLLPLERVGEDKVHLRKIQLKEINMYVRARKQTNKTMKHRLETKESVGKTYIYI